MNKNIKYALVFTGGLAVGFGICGYKVLKYARNDGCIRSAIIDETVRQIMKDDYGKDIDGIQSYRSTISFRRCYEDRDTKTHSFYSDFDNVVFETCMGANKVLEKMNDIVDKYGFVTVADLYNLNNIPASVTDSKYGWTNIRNCVPVYTSKGYTITLPTPILID